MPLRMKTILTVGKDLDCQGHDMSLPMLRTSDKMASDRLGFPGSPNQGEHGLSDL